MNNILRISFMVNSEHFIPHARVLIESLRLTGGMWATTPTLIMVPNHIPGLLATVAEQITYDHVMIAPFAMDGNNDRFPFKDKVYAAAEAEKLSENFNNLAWIDNDMFFVNPPIPFILADGKRLAYRPVDKMLIGSRATEDCDHFWKSIYEAHSLDESKIFTVTTSVDQQNIRAYFNAGLIVVRPQDALLQLWKSNFVRLYLLPTFSKYYQQNSLYAIFIHQAVLAGTILSRLKKHDMQELAATISYPLHLHSQYPQTLQPLLNETICCRYDTYFNKHCSQDLKIKEPLKSLLTENSQNLRMVWTYEM